MQVDTGNFPMLVPVTWSWQANSPRWNGVAVKTIPFTPVFKNWGYCWNARVRQNHTFYGKVMQGKSRVSSMKG
jgi:hypothetical protein